MAEAKQRTLLGILALVLVPLPLAGFLVARLIEKKTPPDTNANTLAMIASILSLWVGTLVGLAVIMFLVAIYGLSHPQH